MVAPQHAARTGSRVLVTAFEPFNGATRNTSWETVRILALHFAEVCGPLSLMRLPVTWDSAAPILINGMQRLQPALVVMTGQGADDSTPCFERYAHNRCLDRPDNHGQPPPASVVLAGAPDRYAAPLDVVALHTAVAGAVDVPLALSEDAGGYICNYVSYHCYHALAQQPHPLPALFVHLPPLSATLAASGVAAAVVPYAQLLATTIDFMRRWYVTGDPQSDGALSQR